jgi:spore germination protein GerM
VRRPRRQGRSAAVAALVLAACGLALAACGIPIEATARAVGPVPAKVNARLPVTPTTAAPTVAGDVALTVFFIATGTRLVPKARYVKPPASITTAVNTLLAGPTTHERYSLRLTTALSPSIKLLRASRSGTVATVDFTQRFGSLTGTEEILGVAQVVFTVAETVQPSVGVIFEINGIPIPVPVATGDLVGLPVHESDYASLRSQTTTTATT